MTQDPAEQRQADTRLERRRLRLSLDDPHVAVMRLLPLVLAAALGPGIAHTLVAQPAPVPGASVRVWSPELRPRPQAAILGVWTLDSIALHAPTQGDRAGMTAGAAPSWIVTSRSVTRLDLQVPRSRGEGARTFGLVGATQAGLTALVLSALAGYLGAEFTPRSAFRDFALGAAGFGVVGAVVGAVPGKRCHRVPLPDFPEASPAAPGR